MESDLITFTPTSDEDEVRRIMTHPKIFEHMMGDYGVSIREAVMPMQETVLRLRVENEGEVVGLFVLVPHSPVCWEMHTCLLPSAWGFRAKKIFDAFKEYVWNSEAGIQRLVFMIPETHQVAVQCARRNGLSLYGINPKSVVKKGVLTNMLMYGISRPEGR